MQSPRHYEYPCNGYAIRHTSCSDIYSIEDPITDECYAVAHSLRVARKLANNLPKLFLI